MKINYEGARLAGEPIPVSSEMSKCNTPLVDEDEGEMRGLPS